MTPDQSSKIVIFGFLDPKRSFGNLSFVLEYLKLRQNMENPYNYPSEVLLVKKNYAILELIELRY